MRRLCTLAAATLAVLFTAGACGVRVNTTPSMPLGIWLTRPAPEVIARGDIVMVCLRDAGPVLVGVTRGYIGTGSCKNGLEPLVKRVAAVAGDTVRVGWDGVSVNSLPLLNSTPLRHDESGRALYPFQAKHFVVPEGKIWLISGHDPRSFDSRYFGPVPVSDVIAEADPVLTLP